jgi:hypothetical protein
MRMVLWPYVTQAVSLLLDWNFGIKNVIYMCINMVQVKTAFSTYICHKYMHNFTYFLPHKELTHPSSSNGGTVSMHRHMSTWMRNAIQDRLEVLIYIHLSLIQFSKFLCNIFKQGRHAGCIDKGENWRCKTWRWNWAQSNLHGITTAPGSKLHFALKSGKRQNNRSPSFNS